MVRVYLPSFHFIIVHTLIKLYICPYTFFTQTHSSSAQFKEDFLCWMRNEMSSHVGFTSPEIVGILNELDGLIDEVSGEVSSNVTAPATVVVATAESSFDELVNVEPSIIDASESYARTPTPRSPHPKRQLSLSPEMSHLRSRILAASYSPQGSNIDTLLDHVDK